MYLLYKTPSNSSIAVRNSCAVVIIEQYIKQVHVIDNTMDLKTLLKKPDFKLLLSSDSKLEV